MTEHYWTKPPFHFFSVGNNGSSWHVAEAEISSAYKAFSKEKIMGKLGVYIGMAHANVTLEAMPIYYNTSMDINFNERSVMTLMSTNKSIF